MRHMQAVSRETAKKESAARPTCVFIDEKAFVASSQHTMFLVHVLFSTFTCRLEQRSLTLFLQSAWRPHLLAFLSRRRHLPN